MLLCGHIVLSTVTAADFLAGVDFGKLAGRGGLLILVVLTLIQITPIKLNPWSWIARWIGRAINSEISCKLEQVSRKVDSLESETRKIREEAAEQAAINYRVRILAFGDEILHDRRHTKEHFEQILRDIDAYELYCTNHEKFANGVTVMTIQRIREVYTELLRTHDFLV